MFTDNNNPISLRITNIIRYPIHSHENITEIILPLKGDINVIINQECAYVKEGDFYIINNNSIHSIQSIIHESVVAFFYIDLNYYEKKYPYIKYMYFRNNMYSKKCSRIRCDNFDCAKREYKIMFRNKLIGILLSKINKSKVSDDIYTIYEEQLIDSMVNDFNWIQFLNSDQIPSSQLNRYHRVVKYIEDHIYERISLDDIASREYISKNYFCHFWKDISNFSFLERVNFEKIIKSEHFLLTTDDSIASIAEKFDFSDVKYYYKHFKRWYGCTPQIHRKRCRSYMDLEMIHHDIDNREAQELLDDYLVFYSLPSFGNLNLARVADDSLINKIYSLDETHFTKNDMSVVLDLYKYIRIKDNILEINFHAIYQTILLTTVKNFGLTIKIDCSSIGESYFFNALCLFFEFSQFHFGKNIIRRWDYFIKYNENVSLNHINKIKKIVQANIDKATFRYYLEV